MRWLAPYVSYLLWWKAVTVLAISIQIKLYVCKRWMLLRCYWKVFMPYDEKQSTEPARRLVISGSFAQIAKQRHRSSLLPIQKPRATRTMDTLKRHKKIWKGTKKNLHLQSPTTLCKIRKQINHCCSLKLRVLRSFLTPRCLESGLRLSNFMFEGVIANLNSKN